MDGNRVIYAALGRPIQKIEQFDGRTLVRDTNEYEVHFHEGVGGSAEYFFYDPADNLVKSASNSQLVLDVDSRVTQATASATDGAPVTIQPSNGRGFARYEKDTYRVINSWGWCLSVRGPQRNSEEKTIVYKPCKADDKSQVWYPWYRF
jgi:hypothetical protein